MSALPDANGASEEQVPVRIVDSDVHPGAPLFEQIQPYLPTSWREEDWVRFSFGAPMYSTPGPSGVYRADAMTGKGRPGSDPRLMDTQLLLDAGVDIAILWALVCRHVADPQDEAVVCGAMNEWMAETWLSRDNYHGRYRGTITITGNDIRASVAEIEKWGGDKRFAQIGFDPIGVPPIGTANFDPILKAAVKYNLPISMHFITSPSMNVLTPVGFLAYASQFRVLFPFAYLAQVTSALTSGVFDKYPTLRLICIEAGLSWVVPLMWRLEKHWDFLPRGSKRNAFEYLDDNIRFTTQPIEEPEKLRDWQRLLELGRGGRSIMFSTDYPHFDFDSPAHVEVRLPRAIRSRIMYENAIETYGLPTTRSNTKIKEVARA
jgi:uncharacterized protein